MRKGRLSMLAALIAVGCGRLDFEQARPDGRDGGRDGGGGGDGGAPDAATFGRCGVSATAPDPVTIAGSALSYTNFQGSADPGSGVAYSFTLSGVDVGSGVTGSDGGFAITATTGGSAQLLVGMFSRVDLDETVIYEDLPVDRPITGWPVQVIGGSSLDTIYMAGSVSHAMAKGTLVVDTFDCSGQPAGDVSLEIVPPPGSLEYTGSDGYPDRTLTATDPGYGIAIGFNATPAPTTIHVTHGAFSTTLPVVDVGGNDVFTVVDVHVP